MMQKKMWTILGSVGGAAVLGTVFLLAWNSREARLMRGTKKAEKILVKLGSVLQSIGN